MLDTVFNFYVKIVGLTFIVCTSIVCVIHMLHNSPISNFYVVNLYFGDFSNFIAIILKVNDVQKIRN